MDELVIVPPYFVPALEFTDNLVSLAESGMQSLSHFAKTPRRL